MARVSIYVPQAGIPSVSPPQVADTSPLIGQLSDKMFAAYDEIERRDGNIETALRSSELRVKYLNRVREDRDNGRITKGYTPSLLEELDQEIGATIGATGNSYARDGLTLALADLRGDLVTSALNVESEWRMAAAENDVAQSITNNTSVLTQPGVPWTELEKQFTTTIALIEGQALPETVKNKMRDLARGMGDAYLATLAQTNPQAVLDLLGTKGHPIRQMYSPERTHIYINQAQSELKQRAAEAKSALAYEAAENAGITAEAQRDLEASAIKGIAGSHELIDQATRYLKEGPRQKFLAQYDRLLSVGQSLIGIDKQPHSELMGRLNEIEAEEETDTQAEGFAERVQSRDLQRKSINAVTKARANDPVAALAASEPAVGDAWAAFDTTPTAQTLRAAVTATKAGIVARGTPGSVNWVIDRRRAARIAGAMNAAKPDDAAEMLSFYANSLEPEDWNKMFRSLKGGGLDGVMSIAATIIDPGSRAKAIGYGRTSPGAYKIEKEAGASSVQSEILGDPAYNSLTQSLSNSGLNGDIAPLFSMLERYTLGEMASGVDASQARANAIKAVITDNYNFVDAGRFKVRVPITAGVDPTLIRTTLRSILDEIDTEEQGARYVIDPKTGQKRLVEPAKDKPMEFATPRYAPGTIVGDIPAQVRRGIAVTGGWIVSEDETGVYLARDAGTKVLDNKGALIHFTWKDLEAASTPGDLWNTFRAIPPRSTGPEPVKVAPLPKPPPIVRPRAAAPREPARPQARPTPNVPPTGLRGPQLKPGQKEFEPDDHPELYPGSLRVPGPPLGAAKERAKANAKQKK